MNVYEAMGRIVDYAISYLDIVPDTTASNEDVATIAQLLDAYAELAPDWANAPEWAQWYVIDADDEAKWYAKEPAHDIDGWHVIGVTNVSYCESVDLPLGIDWRLCKWSRPEAA